MARASTYTTSLVHRITDRLISRKLWVAVATSVMATLFPDLDNTLKMEIIGAVGVVYVLVQGLVDYAERSR